jgi:hypothetical protein
VAGCRLAAWGLPRPVFGSRWAPQLSADPLGSKEMQLTRLLALVSAIVLAGPAWSQDWKSRIAEAQSAQQIKQFYKKFEQFGVLKSETFESAGTQILVLWTEPSLKAEDSNSFAWAYFLRDDRWYLFLDELFPQAIRRVSGPPSTRALRFVGQGELVIKEEALQPLPPPVVR